MKEAIETLIEDYKRRLETVNKMIQENENSMAYSANTAQRLIIKQGCYRTFIAELTRILESENQNP